MACPDMGKNARALPRTSNRVNAKLSRFLPAWTNRSRALANLRRRLSRPTGGTEREMVAQPSHGRATERGEYRPLAPASEQETPGCPDCVRTQNQQLDTMLRLMILAAGGNVDGSAGRNGSTSKR